MMEAKPRRIRSSNDRGCGLDHKRNPGIARQANGFFSRISWPVLILLAASLFGAARFFERSASPARKRPVHSWLAVHGYDRA